MPALLPRAPVAALLSILLLTAGCTRTVRSRPAPDVSHATATSAPIEAAPGGCGGPAAALTGVRTEQVEVAGTVRTYIAAVPDSYSGVQPLPLVLNFHGFGSSAAQQAAYSRLNELGPERGFLVVTPQGSGSPARWTLPGTLPGVDEVAFVRALLDELRTLWCVDEQRVYATGMSNGAAFAAVLACQLDGRITAIAPVAGINLVEPCESGPPVSVIAFHGTADSVVPYSGGRIVGSFMVRSVRDAVAEWAEYDRCTFEAVEAVVSEHVRRRAYGDCAAQTAVRLYTVEGGGHTWPGAADVPPLGPVTDEIDASRLLLDFFSDRALAPTAART